MNPFFFFFPVSAAKSLPFINDRWWPLLGEGNRRSTYTASGACGVPPARDPRYADLGDNAAVSPGGAFVRPRPPIRSWQVSPWTGPRGGGEGGVGVSRPWMMGSERGDRGGGGGGGVGVGDGERRVIELVHFFLLLSLFPSVTRSAFT